MKQAISSWSKRLVHKVTCPNCWHGFYPEEVWYIAKHPDLLGDAVVGQNEYLRFQPSHFTLKGEAVDPKGFPTPDMACPRCHLQVTEALMEIPPLFISLVGSPASGKSYFLTTMSWELRHLMPRAFLSFTDADPVANVAIHEYEQTLFLNPNPDLPTEIRKTQAEDPRLYRMSLIGDASIRFPVPLQFTVWPTPEHPKFASAGRIGRIVVLYDNAGEDFLPGAEDRASAAIQHLARSQVFFVLFDPTQDPRFRECCKQDDPQFVHGLRPELPQAGSLLRQETLLKQAANRVRQHLGISQDKRIQKPLIVIVPKFDVWRDVADVPFASEPYEEVTDGGPLRVKVDQIEQASAAIRGILANHCPEFVATAEGLSSLVRYIPVSSLGRSPDLVQRAPRKFYGICPKDIRPRWATVPLMYCLCKWTTDIVWSSQALITAEKRERQ